MENSIKTTSAHIVLGLGFGDEGKGTTVDHLCNTEPNPIVIRFSGGPQSGHAVEVDGKRHIHSNFGSGTFRNNTPTLFSEHTLIYPVTIAREAKLLDNPLLYIHPLAKIITPWDVFDNKTCSDNLADGSCGLGIHKTMLRNECNIKLYAVDLIEPEILAQKTVAIKSYYSDIWFKSGILYTDAQWLEDEIDSFFSAIDNISWNIAGYDMLDDYSTLVFEGSQGILLDMDHGVFPHVTHANTTSKNAVDILDKIGWIRTPKIYYVTRSYSTRHGNGPYIQEDQFLFMGKGKETNVYNEFQGNFRKAGINYSKLNYAIEVDKIYSRGCITILVVTCLDQQPIFDFSLMKHEFEFILKSQHPDSKYFITNKTLKNYGV